MEIHSDSIRKHFIGAVELVLISVVVAAACWWFHGKQALISSQELAPGEVTVSQILSLESEVLWVDARERPAWEAGRIGDAVWLNEGAFESGIEAFFDRWHPEVKVVVYCNTEGCDASGAVASRLRTDFAIENVWVLKGGWQAWNR